MRERLARPRHFAAMVIALLTLVAIPLAACGDDASSAATTSAPLATSALNTASAAASVATAATSGSGSSGAATAVSANGSTTAVSYQDLFAYCGAAGDALHPAAPYAGPTEPPAVVTALEKASGAAPGGLDHFAQQNAVYWRCMHSSVYGCSPGANLECWDVDTNQQPTQAMQQWCVQMPNGNIPASVTGHSTIYEWTCDAGSATRGRQLVQLDDAGLNSRIWYKLTP